LIDADSYREIVRPAIQWAFEKEFAGITGRPTIRKALESAAFDARDGAFDVLTQELLAYLGKVDLNSKQDWYLHSMRETIEALMANPTCEEAAKSLGAVLREVNRVQRARPRPARLFP
jgi:hypothetical protein